MRILKRLYPDPETKEDIAQTNPYCITMNGPVNQRAS